MSLSDITKKIQVDAEKSRDEILHHASKRVDEITKDTETKKTARSSEFEVETQAILKRNEQKVATSAELESKKKLDTTKRNLVDDVFNEALKKLVESDDTAYENTLVSLLKTLPQDTKGLLKTPSKRSAVAQKAAKAAGLELQIEEDESILGGCIIATDTYEYNLTFEKLVSDKKRALDVDVAQKLFS